MPDSQKHRLVLAWLTELRCTPSCAHEKQPAQHQLWAPQQPHNMGAQPLPDMRHDLQQPCSRRKEHCCCACCIVCFPGAQSAFRQERE